MKIVITGVPQIGKTTMARMIAREFASEIVVRQDGLECLRHISQLIPQSSYGKKCSLRAAYHLMAEMENMIHDMYPTRAVVCDRGTLDCLNLWPDMSQSFFADLQTSLDTELMRYDWVLDICGSDQRTQNFWRHHPRYISIPSEEGFSVCTMQIARAVKEILAGHSYQNVCAQVHQRDKISSLNPREIRA